MSATPYLPPLLPLTVSDDAWGSFGMLEFNAVSSLAELNGMMQASAKADLFWLTWLLQEARAPMSSKVLSQLSKKSWEKTPGLSFPQNVKMMYGKSSTTKKLQRPDFRP